MTIRGKSIELFEGSPPARPLQHQEVALVSEGCGVWGLEFGGPLPRVPKIRLMVFGFWVQGYVIPLSCRANMALSHGNPNITFKAR